MTTRPVQAESERTYYTDARLAILRSNLKQYGWARQKRDEIFAAADRWARYDDEKLRSIVIPPRVPRGYQVNNFGCPVHGVEVHAQGLYKWVIDFDNPFKVTCPAGGETYPSNDFARYLGSDMVDRSLLTGPYPDDGWGWPRPGEEEPYWFVAYYTHWSMRQFLPASITSLSKAALLCEDPEQAGRYAHKCALILWQLSVYYPEYAYEKQSREGRARSDYKGKLFNAIWEVDVPVYCAPAYDAVRPFLKQDTALQKLAGKTAEEIDAMIRERLLLEAATCITDQSRRIRGNYGSHQWALVILSQVLNEQAIHPTSEEMIQYVLANPNIDLYTDLGIRDALENLIYRDGMPFESPGYNRGWVSHLTDVAEALIHVGVNLFETPRFKKLLTWPFEIQVAGQFTPSHGDTGDMFARGAMWSPEVCRTALPHIRDPRMARVLRSDGGLENDLFDEPSDELLARFSEAETPPTGCNTFHFPAYGLANLQCGSEENRTAVSFFYGSHGAHMHHDQLNISLFSYGNALLTDIGYPEQTDPFNHKRYGFFNNTIAHNTVVVDAVKQGRGPGKLHAFQPNGFAQVVDASCEGAYPDNVDLYRRANMLVQVTPTQSYLFDVFYVRGGHQHDYSAHGTQAEFFCDPPLGPVQKSGTLAGPDVPYEHFYDDPELKDRPLGSVPYGGYRGSGYQFLTGVRSAPFRGEAVCEWRLTEPKEGQPERAWQGIGLRAHLVGESEELIACDGPVQKYNYLPKTVKFLIRRRTGSNLASTFATLYEPYKDQPWIERVSQTELEPDDGRAAGVLVELTDGGRHYLFHSLAPNQAYTLDNRVYVEGQAACLVLDGGGDPVRAMLLNGAKLAMGDFSLKGKGLRRSKIVSVDYDGGTVEIAHPLLHGDLLPGQAILVAPDGFADCVTLQKVISKTRFWIGNEDLQVAGGPIVDIRPGENQILSGAANPHAQIGMTVFNCRKAPQGRLAEKIESGWTLDRTGLGPLKPEDFPKAKGDRMPRYSVVMAAPGDEVCIPHLAQFQRR